MHVPDAHAVKNKGCENFNNCGRGHKNFRGRGWGRGQGHITFDGHGRKFQNYQNGYCNNNFQKGKQNGYHNKNNH